MRKPIRVVQLAVLVGVVGFTIATCAVAVKKLRGRSSGGRSVVGAKKYAPVAIEARPVVAGHPRLILDEPTRARLRAAAVAKTPAWTAVLAGCEKALAADLPGEYEAFVWTYAVAELSLCWHATGEERFARGAVHYLEGLLDDRAILGDGAGGENVVRHDSGYPIRTYGVFAALAYDWLHDAPGMTADIRARIVQRLDAWIAWFRESGYEREQPVSNYFFGYLTAVAFAGLAVAGEAPEGDEWLAFARDDLLGGKVVPRFADALAGGDYPEGWQYGELVVTELALIVAAFRTATGTDLLPHLPWLREVVVHHTHALHPTMASVYDNGTWGEHPAHAWTLALTAIPIALPADDPRAAEARWLARHIKTERAVFPWVALLGEQPGAVESDPHASAPLSYSARGTGLSLFRSDWSEAAVWLSLQAGPRIAESHQHADQGHFSLVRGADQLLVDGGAGDGDATINHNTLLIDDGGRVNTYPPNQTPLSTEPKTTVYADDGKAAIAVGEIGEAYAPACIREGCSKRSVKRVTRTVVYVRPGLVVIDDRVVLDKGGDGVVWAAHAEVAPSIAGPRATIVVGASRADVVVLEPDGAVPTAVKEPNGGGEGVWRASAPRNPMWRLETATPRGNPQRHLRHWITAGAREVAGPDVARVGGQGLSGGRALVDGRSVAVIFVDADTGGTLTLPAATDLVVVALPAGKKYRAAVDGCTVSVKAAADGAEGTVVSLSAMDCR